MASNSDKEGDSFGHWSQLIFTHDSKPPVLISKHLVRLGRKEGEKKKSGNITWLILDFS